MAQNKYIKQNGEVIYPITKTENVLNKAGLDCFGWCNGIMWCYATRSSTSTVDWTLNANFGSNGIKINTLKMDGTVQRVTFTSSLASTNYGVWVSAEVGGTASEILGVYGRTTSGFAIDCANYNGAATQPVQISILIIY